MSKRRVVSNHVSCLKFELAVLDTLKPPPVLECPRAPDYGKLAWTTTRRPAFCGLERHAHRRKQIRCISEYSCNGLGLAGFILIISVFRVLARVWSASNQSLGTH